MFKKIDKKYNKGFSIIEMVIVVFVITMGLLGLSSVVIQNISAQNLDKNTLIASGLAQEGVELVRQKRDNNWLENEDWNKDLALGTYQADYLSGLTSDTNYRLYLNNDGFYDHDESGQASQFIRTIILSDNGSDSINVKSKVEWQEKKELRNYIAETNLYGWK